MQRETVRPRPDPDTEAGPDSGAAADLRQRMTRATAHLIACRVLKWPPGPRSGPLQAAVAAARAELSASRAPGFHRAFRAAARDWAR